MSATITRETWVSDYLHGAEGRSQAVAIDNERRHAARFALLIRPAKLVCGPYEYPCVMRDVSEAGLSVRLFHPIPEADGYQIEMLSGDCFAIERVWANGLTAGFRFCVPIDLDQILANAGPFPNRPVRLKMEVPAILEQGTHKSNVRLHNLSQQGAKLSAHDYLALGQMVVLESDCLPRTHAKVCWRNGQQYGVVFEETFKLAELSALAVRIHSSSGFLHHTNSSAA